MTRVEGILKLRGSAGGLTFYKTGDGYIAKMKSGPAKEKILTSASYQRTRENISEFANCVKKGQLLKLATIQLNKQARDGMLTARLNQLMYRLKELDSVNARGERNVATGLLNAAGKNLLQQLEFNVNAPLTGTLKKAVAVNFNGGQITFNADGKKDIVFARGATHACVRAGIARVNFTSGEKELLLSNQVLIQKGAATAAVNLQCSGSFTIQGVDIAVLCITFSEEVNGQMYDLRNGAYNSMKVIAVG